MKHHNLTPKQLVVKAKKNRESVEDQLHDFVTKVDREGKSPGYILNYIKAVRTWLDYNGIKLIRRIKIRNSQSTPTIENEQVPTKEELRTRFSYAGERARASISLIAFSGLRPQVLGNYQGLDGLKLKNLPELEIIGGNIKFNKIPTQIIIPSQLSKANNKYMSTAHEKSPKKALENSPTYKQNQYHQRISFFYASHLLHLTNCKSFNTQTIQYTPYPAFFAPFTL